MYKFYAAYLTNELLSHFIRFFEKKNEIDELWEAFDTKRIIKEKERRKAAKEEAEEEDPN